MKVLPGPHAGSRGFAKTNTAKGGQDPYPLLALTPSNAHFFHYPKKFPLELSATSYLALSPFPSKQPISMKWLKILSPCPMTCARLGWVEMWGHLGYDKPSIVISEHKQKSSSEITLIKLLCLKKERFQPASIWLCAWEVGQAWR